MNKTDTPETDELMSDSVMKEDRKLAIQLLAELARALERDLSAAQERIKELEGARSLVAVIFAEDRGDIDGGWLQDEAVKHGVLIEVEATEPCIDPEIGNCACAEYGDFPMTCYRVNPALLTNTEKS
jgi:hypothetical protein